MTDQCIFCNLKADALIYRDNDGIVIIDDPVRPGHVLVGSRVHQENLHDLSPEDAAAMMRLASRVAKSIVSLTGASKVYVTAIGDKDKHFHVHLLPKMKADPNLGPFVFGSSGWAGSFLSDVSSASIDHLNDALRKALAR